VLVEQTKQILKD